MEIEHARQAQATEEPKSGFEDPLWGQLEIDGNEDPKPHQVRIIYLLAF